MSKVRLLSSGSNKMARIGASAPALKGLLLSTATAAATSPAAQDMRLTAQPLHGASPKKGAPEPPGVAAKCGRLRTTASRERTKLTPETSWSAVTSNVRFSALGSVAVACVSIIGGTRSSAVASTTGAGGAALAIRLASPRVDKPRSSWVGGSREPNWPTNRFRKRMAANESSPTAANGTAGSMASTARKPTTVSAIARWMIGY